MAGFVMPSWPVWAAWSAIIWVAVAFLVGRYAAHKGRRFGFYFASALVVGWPIPLVVALLVPRSASADD